MSQPDKSSFERERDRLIAEIADNLGRCLNNINTLNRNIENVTSVGNFESVHDLWSQFEDVVARGSYDEAVRQPDSILKGSRAHEDAGLSPERGEERATGEED